MDQYTTKAIKAYLDRGWYLFPINLKTKSPCIKDNLNRASNDLEQTRKWASEFPACGWAVSLAKSGLVCVDVDTRKGGMEAWQEMIGEHNEPVTLKQKTGSDGLHYVFEADSGYGYTSKIRDGIDVKHNGYILLCPTKNLKTGKSYRWLSPFSTTKIEKMPTWVKELTARKQLKRPEPEQGVPFNIHADESWEYADGSIVIEKPSKQWIRKIIGEIVKHPFGRDQWFRFACALHSEYPAEDGFEMFLELSQGPSYEEGDEDKARVIWDSLDNEKDSRIKFPTFLYDCLDMGIKIEKPSLAEDKLLFADLIEVDAYRTDFKTVFNKQMAIVDYYNKRNFYYLGDGEHKTPVIKITDGGKGTFHVKSISTRGFMEAQAFCEYRYWDTNLAKPKVKVKPASRVWLESSCRGEVQKLTFRPSGRVKKGEFNLFSGFPCEEVGAEIEGGPDAILEMIERSLCGGDASKAGWLLDWMAHIIQKPEVKPTVVPVLIGRQGTGKGILADLILKRLLGDLYAVAESSKQLMSQFNLHLSNKLLTFIDEATWRGNKEEDGILKRLTGSPTLSVEEKFGLRYDIENYSRYLIASNNPEAVSVEAGNRRYVIIEAAEDLAGKSSFFGPIAEKIRHTDEMGKFMRFLRQRDIREFDPYSIPKGNTAGTQAKIASEGPVAEFLADLYYENPLQVWDIQEKGFDKKLMYHYFLEFCDRAKPYQKGFNETKFWMSVYRLSPGLPKSVRRQIGGVRKNYVCQNVDDFFENFRTNLEISKSDIFTASDFYLNRD